MRVLMLYCHPVDESYCAALRDVAREALTSAGHEIDVIDLYAEGFEPTLDRAERLAHLDPAAIRDDIRGHVDRLRAADVLMFVYPTWWYGLPALLKGWLDRVLRMGVAFDLPEGANVIQPRLTNLRRLVVITTYGSPWWLIRWVGDAGRRTLARGIKLLCPKAKGTIWLALYGLDTATPAKRTAFMEKIRRRLAGLR